MDLRGDRNLRSKRRTSTTRLHSVNFRPIIWHDDVIKWKHFPRYWPFVRGIYRSPVNSPHKGHWRGALIFSLIYSWINGWVNNREAGDLRRHRAYYDVTVMVSSQWQKDTFLHRLCPKESNKPKISEIVLQRSSRKRKKVPPPAGGITLVCHLRRH